jgi:AMP nucleosidase
MKTKSEIVDNWLVRYTGLDLKNFGEYILLTNFDKYVDTFSDIMNCRVHGIDKNMPSATSDNITIINFGMGSPNAATIMDLLSAIRPKAVLFLGKCGGLKKRIDIGDFILPIGAIRGDGTSNDYFPPEVPAMPSFALQKAISTTIREHTTDYWTGTVYTTNRRVWEYDNKIPVGAFLLVSDSPMFPDGVKTLEKDEINSKQFDKKHIEIGIDSLKKLQNNAETVRHLRF